ncbi:competence type IV pilus minor pilin ComGF [Gottfriedia luciferensis]|uniref:competence type IV pilus minor pilin ComGF n=1 Tax=Gottfriedia luciferensis TaxID=178774 RepID=UPI0013022E58|nr:competence type IV pilus minor pilin ComGF [Gottfriedia luciferensis]
MKKLWNEQGFTLLETLFSLIIFIIIISITTSSLKSFVNRNNQFESVNKLEWDNFIKEVQKEANKSISFTIYSDMLIFEDSIHVTSSYRKYATIIRRQKLGTGHEIVLQNIRSIEFQQISKKQIFIKVVDLKGGIYEKSIRLFID